LKIIVLMGGNSSEKKVSMMTGKAVLEALKNQGIEAQSCIYNGEIENYFNQLKDSDLVFIALHGGDGENGKIQAFFEKEKILYTGSNSITSRIAINKHLTKKIMLKNNIPTPEWKFFPELTFFKKYKDYNFRYPSVIKPNEEGSTFGISIVYSYQEVLDQIETLREFDIKSGIIVENYIKGRELTLGILNNISLPCIEIKANNSYYDYNAKYFNQDTKYICPAKLDQSQLSLISKYSILLNDQLGCLDYSRVDFRMDEKGNFYCLEINTLPGLTSKSLLPKAANQSNIKFNDLVLEICNLALKRR
tara:strand:+ start:331 stop:1245 length:915 start_codon:yes stop_codon:yes gene_type:complete